MKEHSGIVLLVEDNGDDATFVALIFQQCHISHPLVTVRDGEQALKYLRGEGPYQDRKKFPFPSLLMLDLYLPVGSGFEVLRWLRTESGFKRLPVSVFSGSAYPKDLERSYELGANCFVTKPFSLDALKKSITALTSSWLQCCTLPSSETPP